MAKAGARVKITLRCSECKQRNYVTQEQEEHSRPSGEKQVLPLLQKAHAPHRDQVMMLAEVSQERRVKPNV